MGPGYIPDYNFEKRENGVGLGFSERRYVAIVQDNFKKTDYCEGNRSFRWYRESEEM